MKYIRSTLICCIGTASAFSVAPVSRPAASNQLPVRAALPAGDLDISQDAILAIGVAALGVAGFVSSNSGDDAAVSGSGKSSKKKSGGSGSAEEEAEPVDVSIPYDSAARLAFSEWAGSSKKGDEALFSKFEALYIKKTVASVTAKKLATDLEFQTKALDNVAKKVDADLDALKSS